MNERAQKMPDEFSPSVNFFSAFFFVLEKVSVTMRVDILPPGLRSNRRQKLTWEYL